MILLHIRITSYHIISYEFIYFQKKLSECADTNWESFIYNNNLTFFLSANKTIGIITPQINNIFIRDHDTQKLYKFLGNNSRTFANFNSSNQQQLECICNNLLEEVKKQNLL